MSKKQQELSEFEIDALYREPTYQPVDYLSLDKTPRGQTFMIQVAGLATPILGSVAHDELPIVAMRPDIPFTLARRYLQVPGPSLSRVAEDSDLIHIERYYNSTREGKRAGMVPATLGAITVAWFMEVDHQGEVILNEPGTITCDAVPIACVSLGIPILDATLNQYREFGDTASVSALEPLVGK